jgi:engulfment/cell motility protein 1
MSTHTNEDLTSCILDFQANWIRVVDSKKRTMPDPDTDTFHAAMLKFIWQGAKLEEDLNTNNEVVKWRKLGFGTEDVIEEFKDVGVLGLECLVGRNAVYLLDCAKNDVGEICSRCLRFCSDCTRATFPS